MESRPFLIFDGNRRIEAVSPGSGDVLGLPEGSLLGMACREAFDCPACSGDACPLRQALSGDAVEGLLPANRTGGSLAVTATAVLSADRLRAVVQLRPRAPEEAALGAGVERVLEGLRSVTGSDMAALAFYDEATREIRWQVTSGSRNPGAANAIRLRPGEGFAGRIILTALPLTTFRFPQDLTGHPDAYPIFQAEGLKAALGVPVRGDSGVVGVLMVASRSDRDYADEDLATLTQMATSLGLAAQMMCLYGEAVRAERAKLAHEVHDGLSQNLFGLKLLLFDLQQQYQASPSMKQGLTEIIRLLDGTLVEVRRFIADLRRTSQAQSGLVGAISDYLAHYYRLTRLQVEFAVRLEPGEDVVCQDPAEVLRIVQEALMNVHRHAMAGRVWVEVARAWGHYRIMIDDDGRGFDPEAVEEGHYGLATMRERAVRLGGRLEVESAPGRGTTVTLLLPV